MTATREYLVHYGLGGFLGRFRSEGEFARDDRVIVHSQRGVEPGTILGAAPDSLGPSPEGDVLREATSQDVVTLDELRPLAAEIITCAQEIAGRADLPLLFLDGEILLDPREAILHTVHWDECDATPLFAELSTRFGFPIKLADLTTRPAQKTACSTCGEEKSGCDSCGTGGGCSTGSCSSGSVKSADELTAYFAGLRKQMESAGERVSLH